MSADDDRRLTAFLDATTRRGEPRGAEAVWEDATAGQSPAQSIVEKNHRLTGPRTVGSRLTLPWRRLAVISSFAIVAIAAAVVAVQTGDQDSGSAVDLDTQRATSPQADITVPPDLEAARERIFTSDWRPELSAESVRCVTSEFPVMTSASESVLDQSITAADFVDACEGTDAAPTYERPSVCYDDHAAQVSVIEGECTDHPQLRPMDAATLGRLNDLRIVEIELLAVPASASLDIPDEVPVGCPTVQEATEWAGWVLDAHSADDIKVRALDEGDACYRPIAYWAQSEILVQPYGFQPD